jgi:hypothetical protein
MGVEIRADAAMANRHRPRADWAVARRRLRGGVVVPIHHPSFSLTSNDTVFTMGSCFARNIEKHLATLGCRVPAYDFWLPESERTSSTPNDALTLFTPASFVQIIEWVDRIHSRDGIVTADDCEPWLFHYADGTAWDLGLAAVLPTPLARVIARRQELFDLYRSVFTAACVMMTPGLIETWYDTQHGVYTTYAPIMDGELIDPERYAVRVLGYDECYQALLRSIDIIRRHNPAIKVLITVSPIPLRYTFTSKDILTANSYSKSVLRAVCEQIAADREAVDYFPSFEAVNYSHWHVWQRDRRHVSDRMISKIVQTVITQYFSGSSPEIERKYLYPITQRLRRAFFGL